MPGVYAYLLNFKPLKKFLEDMVVKKNPFRLKDKFYSSTTITRFLVKASLSINRSLRDIERIFSFGPTARTVLNRLYEKDPEEILEAFNKYNASLYGKIVKNLTRGNQMTFVNLDHHLEPYWGEDIEWVHKGVERQSTTKFLPIETYSIQISDFKITLMIRPYTWVSRDQDPETRLRWARSYVEALKWINREFVSGKICLVADGRFYVSLILTELNNAGFYFIVRGSLGSFSIRKVIKDIDFDSVLPEEGDVIEVPEYTVSSGHNRPFAKVSVRLIFVRRGGQVVLLVTNLPPVFTAKYVVEVYKARFWIENSYRDSRQMRIRTCSRSLSVRYVCVVIGFILLNFFILAFRRFSLACMGFRTLSLVLVILYALEGGEKT